MHNSQAKSPLRLGELRVLLIDDNTAMRGLVKSLLYSMGIKDIAEASEGGQAYDMLLDRKVDLIITGWKMNPIDGIEFVRMVRRDTGSPCPKVNIIMLSANTVREEVMVARDAGITEFLAKPMSAGKLYERVLSVLKYPREFVKVGKFVGPDRRRTYPGGYLGPDRRGDEFVID